LLLTNKHEHYWSWQSNSKLYINITMQWWNDSLTWIVFMEMPTILLIYIHVLFKVIILQNKYMHCLSLHWRIIAWLNKRTVILDQIEYDSSHKHSTSVGEIKEMDVGIWLKNSNLTGTIFVISIILVSKIHVVEEILPWTYWRVLWKTN